MLKQPISLKNFSSRDTNPIIHLFNLYAYRRKMKTSEFHERVSIKTVEFYSTIQKENDGKYTGNLRYVFEAVGDDTKTIHAEGKIEIEGLYASFDVTEEFLRTLLVLAFSGIYATPYDFQAFVEAAVSTEYYKNRIDGTIYCEECGQHFNKNTELIEHLKETLHMDSIYDDYPHFPLFKI